MPNSNPIPSYKSYLMTNLVWSYYDTNAAAELGWVLSETWKGWLITDSQGGCNYERLSHVKELASKGHPLAQKAIQIASKPYCISLSKIPSDLSWSDYEELLGKRCNIGTILGLQRGHGLSTSDHIYLIIANPGGNTITHQVNFAHTS